MVTNPRKILFISHFPHYKMGGQKSMIALAENLDYYRYIPEFLINGEGPLSDYLREKGFTCHIRKLYPFKPKHYPEIIRNIFWLRKLTKERNISILHPDYERDALLAGLGKKSTKTKMVWHVRLTRPTKQDRFIVKLANRIIAISEGATQRFEHYHESVKNIINIVYNGVDTDLFKSSDNKQELRTKLNIPIYSKVCLFVGQITEHKGVLELLQAAIHLKENHTFVFCGSFENDSIKSQFEMTCNENSLSNVIIAGQIENIHNYMAASDCLILPSHEGNEGMGRVIFEAMSCGAIPIASNISGVRDAITSETGYLIPEKSPESIVKAILDINTSSDKYELMSKAARKRAIEVFSIKKHSDSVMKIYDEVLS